MSHQTDNNGGAAGMMNDSEFRMYQISMDPVNGNLGMMEGEDMDMGMGGGESFNTSHNTGNALLELYILCEKAYFDDTDEQNDDCWEEVRSWLRSHSITQAREAAMITGENNVTPLYLACRNNAPIDIIEVLVGVAPKTVEMDNANGWLPMHTACHFGASLEVLRVLADAYPDSTHRVDLRGRTPLHFALGNIDRPISPAAVLLLLTGGAGKCTDMGGMLPLHYACAYGASEAVLNVLLEGHHDTIAMRDSRGRTPLHIAMGNCNRDASPAIVRTLLQKNPAVINMVESENGYLPLHMLATASEALTTAGADRSNAQACLDYYLNAKPDTSTEFFTTFQELPDWLIDHAVQSKIVQQVLNNKIAQRFPTFIQISDVFFLILTIVSYVLSVLKYIDYRTVDSKDDSKVEFKYTVGLYIGGVWFALRELFQMMSYTRLGIFNNWLLDPLNWVDNSHILVTFSIAVICSTDAIENLTTFRAVAAILLILPFLKLILFLRSMLVDFSVFTSGMGNVLVNLKVFLITIIIILLMFTLLFHGIFQDSESCASLERPSNYYCKNRWDSFLHTVTMFLGEVDHKQFIEDGQPIPIFLFVIFMVLVVVLLANVLIAVVTDNYSFVRKERASIVFWKNRLDFIAEMDALSNFLFSIYNKFSTHREFDDRERAKMSSSRQSSTGVLNYNQMDWLSRNWKDMMNIFDDQRASNPDLTMFSFEFLCFTLLRICALILIPFWILLGMATFGLMWPQQVRQRLFLRISKKHNQGVQMDQRFNQIRATRKEMKVWQESVEKDMATDRKNVIMIKSTVMDLQSDVMRQMKDIKQIMTMLFELQTALETE